MKILSKYKDYYDYLQGIYGMDEKLVLDRRESEHPVYYEDGIYTAVIGDISVEFLHFKGKFYCGESELFKIKYTYEDGHYTNSMLDGLHMYVKPEESDKIYSVRYSIDGITTRDRNNEAAIYIYKNREGWAYSEYRYYAYPRLDQYGIQKILPPHEIWVELSAWLGKQVTAKEPDVPIGDDNVRILSHGFDLKTSFRHRKKK